MELVSVAVPLLSMPPPPATTSTAAAALPTSALLPDRVELVSVAVPREVVDAAAAAAGRVARQGGVGQRRRAVVPDAAAVAVGRVARQGGVGQRQGAGVPDAAAAPLAELPDRVELVSVSIQHRAELDVGDAAAVAVGRVARQGGVGQRRRAVVDDAAAVAEAELPDRVELVSVTVP